MPLCYYKRPTLVPDFANQKKYEEDMKNSQKAKVLFTICFAVSCYRGSGARRAVRVAPPNSFLGTHTQHLSIRPPEL